MFKKRSTKNKKLQSSTVLPVEESIEKLEKQEKELIINPKDNSKDDKPKDELNNHKLNSNNNLKTSKLRKNDENIIDNNKSLTNSSKTDATKSSVTQDSSKSNIKSTITIDFQQDLCKDFLQNGYCGFGDTCKFLHIRKTFNKNNNLQKKDWQITKSNNKIKKKSKKLI